VLGLRDWYGAAATGRLATVGRASVTFEAAHELPDGSEAYSAAATPAGKGGIRTTHCHPYARRLSERQWQVSGNRRIRLDRAVQAHTLLAGVRLGRFR